MGYFGTDKEVKFENPVFPKKGFSEQEVMAGLDDFDNRDVDDIAGHPGVYSIQLMDKTDAMRITKLANMKFVRKNMLFKELLPGTERLILEVKQMIKEMLGYPQEVRVRLTSGGSESIYCAINSAYQQARLEKPEIKEPEIVVPYSIHAAFSKWCHFTGIHIKRIPVGKDSRSDIEAMEQAITPNTILIAGSAPCWPYGLYDHIEALAALAEKKEIWMHVDACLGGFVAPFASKAGLELPLWDFQIPGVRSISADVHKYGFSTKPLSSISYRNKDWEQFHEFTPSDWPDGPYATEAINGSTTAGSVASAWAVMKFLGEEGYLKLARRFIEVKKRYTEEINAIEGCRCWSCDLTPLSFQVPEGLDMFAVMGGLFERNAFCLPGLQPPMIKVSIDAVPDEVIDRFLNALREVIPLVQKGEITIESMKPYF